MPRLLCLFLLLLAALFGGPAWAGPNVILIVTDDQGFGDVGVHGNPHLQTPHLDRFARQGTRWQRFYCSPVCAPTRASLMTGRYYYRTGVIHTSRGGAKMHGDEVTLAERLAEAGYATAIFGKWHLGDNYPMRPQDQGFGEVLVHRSGGIGQTPDRPNSYFAPQLWHNGRPRRAAGYCTDVFFQAALEFIERHRQQPFFVYLPTNAPHTPLQVDERYSRPYRELGLDDATAKVYGMVANIDENVGRLLARLEQLELRRQTVVWFLGDNGPQQRRFNAGLRGRKGSVYEGGIRVPSFLQWPGRLPAGSSVDQMAAHIDVTPTLLELCGVELGEEPLDGRSLAPLLRGKSPEEAPPRIFQCHRGLQPRKYQNCAVVTQRFKLVSHGEAFSREELDTSAGPQWELYDLSDDPGEQRDLARSQPQTVHRLSQLYDDWFADVRSARQFRPGVIHLGSPQAPAVHLCRYQDATYRDGAPRGWQVRVERGGRYRLRIARGTLRGSAELHVSWQGRGQTAHLSPERDSAEFQLAAGSGTLDAWLTTPGQPRVLITDNSTAGDVQCDWAGP